MCGLCPPGYQGDYEAQAGLDYALNNKQVCKHHLFVSAAERHSLLSVELTWRCFILFAPQLVEISKLAVAFSQCFQYAQVFKLEINSIRWY